MDVGPLAVGKGPGRSESTSNKSSGEGEGEGEREGEGEGERVSSGCLPVRAWRTPQWARYRGDRRDIGEISGRFRLPAGERMQDAPVGD